MFRLYGKLPNRKDILNSKLKVRLFPVCLLEQHFEFDLHPQERKYFDSGDYALSKAGKAPQNTVGTAIPNPQIIAHASTVANSSTSPPGSSPGLPATPTGIPIASAGGAGSHGSHVPSSLGAGSPSIPAVGGAGVGSGPSSAKISTSPTTSSMGGTGRPAHPQVSTFPIGSSNSNNSISPNGGSGSGQTAFTMPSGYDGNFSQDRPMAHNPTSGGMLQTGFPQGSNLSTSPAKEGSSLARNEISADDLMDE